jgi:hypothetical protein
MATKFFHFLLLSYSTFFAFCAETDQSIESLFPTTSQYDNEIDTLLLEVKDNVCYFKGFLREDFTNVDFVKLNEDILEGKFEDEIGKKVKKLCRLGINRSNEWSNKAAELFNQKLDEGKNFKEAWPPALNRSYRYKKIMETLLVLGQAQIRIQVAKFLRKLRKVVPETYDLNGVDYIERIRIMFQITGLEAFEIILTDWTRNVKKLWKSLQEARPAIRSHGKFWLKFVEFSEGKLQRAPHITDSLILQTVLLRNSIMKKFFEDPIFGINREELNHW